MMRLSFIVGGVQKAGTTSLFGYLRTHPALLPPSRKELHHFDNETLDWTDPQHAAIARAFPVNGAGRLAFEATPAYLFWPRALERIRDYDPQIRLIFIFRDPIERAWSHWRMEMSRGGETLSFGAAIRVGRKRLAKRNDLRALRDHSYVERGFYAQQLRRAHELFPRRNMLLLRSNELRNRPSAVLATVADFLDIPPFAPAELRADRLDPRRGELSADDAGYLREIYRDDIAAFAALSGLDVSDWPTTNPAAPIQ